LAEAEIYERFWSSTVENLELLTAPFHTVYAAWSEERIYNGWFEAGDIELYYSILRSLRPSRIIEVGAGFSSQIAVEALRQNGGGALLVIDPSPRTSLSEGVEHLQTRVEDVDLAVFRSLAAGDVLFIDSSHTAEEAHHHETILDLLADGVVVHHHDCFFPYPSRHPEEDVLRAYYTKQVCRWEGLVNNALARHLLGPEGYAQIFPAYGRDTERLPGSIYTRKRG
jgi:hypothetical protein